MHFRKSFKIKLKMWEKITCCEVPLYTRYQGRFQDFFQGVAEIAPGGGEISQRVAKSPRGWRNLPGGGEKIARYLPFRKLF